MHQEIIAKAAEVITSKAGYIGGGMEGHAVIALTNKEGYPNASTATIAKAYGINWITFNTSTDSAKANRIRKCNRASVCLSSSKYNITLVGTIEILTDSDTKRDMWFEPMSGIWSGPDDPNFCVLRFNTETYNIYFADDFSESVATGTLQKEGQGAQTKSTPVIEPLFQFDRQCEQAIELYKRAFGAEVIYLGRYGDADPQDRPAKYNEDDTNLIFHAQMRIGNQRIMLADNLFNDLPRGHSVYPVIQFKTDEEVKAAFDVLSDGATIINPISSTTYSSACGSLVDKYGIFWDLMVY